MLLCGSCYHLSIVQVAAVTTLVQVYLQKKLCIAEADTIFSLILVHSWKLMIRRPRKSTIIFLIAG